MPCYCCRHKSLIRDDVTNSLVCESCGIVQEFDSYEARTGFNAPEGVFIRLGTSGTGTVLNYKEKKIYEANKIIDELTFRLDLIGNKASEIKAMVDKITEGEFGLGEWFPVLIGACAYVAMRSDNRSLSVAEVSNAVGCDTYELGRMIMRVVDHLNIKLPEFDIVNSYEKLVMKLSNLGRIEVDMVERMKGQGVFLIQCAVKWFLTTGRRPLPIVVAVLVFVAELNGVKGVTIEEIAREVHAAASTCKLRYKELLEALVKVAQALPWGKDVTMKNVIKNAPFVIQYMEMKSMEKCPREGEGLRSVGFDMGEVVSKCLRKDVVYGIEEDGVEYDNSPYFELKNGTGSCVMSVDDMDKFQLSHECLSMVYNKFLEGDSGNHLMVSAKVHGRKRKRGFDLQAIEWWNGKSKLSKKVLLSQILKEDIGLNTMPPPSFIKGCLANEKRRAKINAAKLRIDRIVHPRNADSGICTLEGAFAQKRKRKSRVNDLDWEDFIIETLLLHQVKEEEIEKGHYNTLLDLHVFNSGIM